MTRHALLLLATVAACARASESMPAAAAPTVGHLACGGATLTARTLFRDVADHDRQVLSQTITLVPPGATAETPLKLDVRPLRQPFLRDTPVLDASATGWACVTASDGRPYVYVVMTCTESPLRPACAGPTREWARFYDTRGRSMDAGLPHDGPRVDALIRRLGLERVVNEGVSMSDPRE